MGVSPTKGSEDVAKNKKVTFDKESTVTSERQKNRAETSTEEPKRKSKRNLTEVLPVLEDAAIDKKKRRVDAKPAEMKTTQDKVERPRKERNSLGKPTPTTSSSAPKNTTPTPNPNPTKTTSSSSSKPIKLNVSLNLELSEEQLVRLASQIPGLLSLAKLT